MNFLMSLRPVGPAISVAGLGVDPAARKDLATLAVACKDCGSPTAILLTGQAGSTAAAAQALAHDAGRQVYRVDLSAVVSKSIGETEKNLDRAFTAAESSGAILFFDEADALFGKRSEVKDAHDKYANIEVSYLLQRMAAYRGTVIVATSGEPDARWTKAFRYAVRLPHRPWP
jgi:SpoVK/Ycf46/Vps4 family AAA+-type ATPase